MSFHDFYYFFEGNAPLTKENTASFGPPELPRSMGVIGSTRQGPRGRERGPPEVQSRAVESSFFGAVLANPRGFPVVGWARRPDLQRRRPGLRQRPGLRRTEHQNQQRRSHRPKRYRLPSRHHSDAGGPAPALGHLGSRALSYPIKRLRGGET